VLVAAGTAAAFVAYMVTVTGVRPSPARLRALIGA
jgi:hypothetical protein